MRITRLEKGYKLWLTAGETYSWAHNPGAAWLCSELSGRRLFVEVDSNGLLDYRVDGRHSDIGADEFNACVADHLPKDLRHLWPAWE